MLAAVTAPALRQVGMHTHGRCGTSCPMPTGSAGALGCLTPFLIQTMVSGTSEKQQCALPEFVFVCSPSCAQTRGCPATGQCPLHPACSGEERAELPHSSLLGCAQRKTRTHTHTLLGSWHFFILAQNSPRDDYLKDESPNTIAKTHP